MANITITFNCGVAKNGITYNTPDTVTGNGSAVNLTLSFGSVSSTKSISTLVGRSSYSQGGTTKYYPKYGDMSSMSWMLSNVDASSISGYLHIGVSKSGSNVFVWDRKTLVVTIDNTTYVAGSVSSGATGDNVSVDGISSMYVGTQSSPYNIAIWRASYFQPTVPSSHSNDFVLIRKESVPSGYTVTFKGINGEVTRTLTGQTTLNSAYNNAAGGNLTTPQSYGGLTYTYKSWDTGGVAWGSTLNSNITLKSVWSVGPYSLTSTSTGNSYIANFYGYDGIFTVRTDEAVSATCNYTVNDYVGGNTKPAKQTSFNVPSTHITQVIGYPIRTTNTSSVWKPKTIAFANGSTTPISGSGTVDGGRQSYTITGTVTANVAITGNEATKHYLDFYDSSKKYHGMVGYRDVNNVEHTNTWVADDVKITDNGTVKSYWHAPQIWKYRNGNGKNNTAEGGTGSGWHWWKDVELKKYDNTTQTWKITNKWKTVGTAWVNCDADLQINR